MKLGLQVYPKEDAGCELCINKRREVRIKYIGEERTRKAAYNECATCGETIAYDARRKSDRKRYCSYKCYIQGSNQCVICDHCGIEFVRNFSKQNKGKNDYNFCSRTCKEKEQCVGGLLELPHFGVDLAYRNKAFPIRELKSKSAIRHRLIELRGNKCEWCGVDSWHGKPIVLEMHRLKGKGSSYSDIDNVVLVCPNCHSTTDDYKNKNPAHGVK